MKILRVAGDLYPFQVGGGALHAHNMSRMQVKMGHEVTVYTAGGEGLPREETVEGYRIERFGPLFKIFGNAVMPSMFFRMLLDKKSYSVIHAHSHLYISTNICALIRKFKETPLIITNHGLMSQSAPGWLNDLYLATLGGWTFKAADRVICYTEEEKEEVARLGVDRRKIVVIHNGIDTSLFKPGDRQGNGGRLLWIGRFVPGKGVEYLIDAFSEAVKVKPWLKLMMIGNGPGLPAMKEKIRLLGLSDKITIKKFIPNTELSAVYQDADVFVLSSLMEGVPRTILEAMSSGLPIVCTELPQLRHIVDQCGLMVPLKDSKALAKMILLVASDPGLAYKLGKCGREKVVKYYSWDDTVSKTMLLYRDVILNIGASDYEGERSDAHPYGRPI